MRQVDLKAILCIFVFLIPLSANAADVASCKGTVLQRRLALVQFGQLADAYIAAKGGLPDICLAPVAGISDAVPGLLKDTSVCGSSKEAAVYYSCEIPVGPSITGASSENSPVVETCRYSLLNQSVSCENRSVVTTFGEKG